MKTFHLPPSGCLMSLSCGIRTEFGTVYEEYVVGTVILGMLNAVDLALGDKGERRERESDDVSRHSGVVYQGPCRISAHRP